MNTSWWPSSNQKWLITVVISILIALMTIVFSNSSQQYNSVVIKGDMQGGNISPVIINHKQNVDPKKLAEELMKHFSRNNILKNKEEQIKNLTETISRLKKGGVNEYKKKALEKLKENKPKEASRLLKKSIFEHAKMRSNIKIIEAQEWIDIGNIADISNDTREAFNSYEKATILDPFNADAWLNLGIISVELGKLETAEHSFYKIDSLEDKTEVKKFQVLNGLGVIYFQQEKLKKSEDYLLKAIEVANLINDKFFLSQAYTNYTTLLIDKGLYKKAESFINTSIILNKKIGRKDALALQYNNLGNIFRINNKYKESEKYFKLSLSLYKSINMLEGIANQNGNLGLLYFNKNELIKSESYHLKSLEINKKLHRKINESIDYSNLADIYLKKNNPEKAIYYFNKSLNINVKKNGRKTDIVLGYARIGEILFDLGRFKKSEEITKRAIRLYDEYKPNILIEKTILSLAYSTLGKLRRAENKFNDALEYFNKAIDIDIETKNYNNAAWGFMNIGIIYKNTKDFDSAIEANFSSLKYSNLSEKPDMSFISGAHHNLAGIYFEIYQYKKSEEHFIKAININRNIKDNKKFLQEEIINLYKIYIDTNNLDKAKEYIKEALIIEKNDNNFSQILVHTFNLGVVNLKMNNLELACANFIDAKLLIKKEKIIHSSLSIKNIEAILVEIQCYKEQKSNKSFEGTN